MSIVGHHQADRAGKTLKWFGHDDENRYLDNLKNNYDLLKEAGWHDPSREITYKFNSHGFRDEEFDNREAGIALGCSRTLGVGVNQQDTWHWQLGKKLGIYIWNLGVGGGSTDCCFRLLDHYINVLKPKFVIYQPPSVYRIELFDSTWKTVLANSNDQSLFLKSWFAYDENTVTQARRNVLAIRYRCYETQTPLFVTPRFPTDCRGRDLMHSGSEALLQFANSVYQERHHYWP